jgi:hypothetical protein
MSTSTIRKRSCLVFVSLFYFNTVFAAPPGAGLDFDIETPEIQHNPASQAVVADQKLVISVRVTDASGVSSVLLHYRTSPVGDFKSVELTSSSNDQYTITLPDELSVGTVEYYLKATDVNGNAVSRGSAYTPLTVDITPTALGLVDPDAPDKGGSKNTVWWVLGGAALLGAAALALGGGGGGGGGDDEPATTGTVTFGGDTP